ncbi:uncharacterized protein LOC110725345 [Chenopodium quinoa]|uniref:Uncharacterized protein n=1 Tax=Chenopodium quinoa TaxID=63459 RepID=A0A803M5B8_CHEQI|nr:uncharacterized protein LOC110725345 [Chenopodium quinoa]
MEGGQGKLTRTQSSLLRSSPTIRSSIQSLSSIADMSESDEPERKLHKSSSTSYNRNPSGISITGITSSKTNTALLTFSVTLLLIFIYLQTDHITTSENLLFALIFIALALFYLAKNRDFLDRSKSVIRNLCRHHHHNHRKGSSVEWYIGDESGERDSLVDFKNKQKMSAFKEGFELYSNGDFYEGEFHKGKSNGSGVYNYFVNGRYEGDWVDGKYDGYGIESWARGSRYRGQYRGGLRHGFGVYRFYTGDTYAGEWFHGQYHGLGLQTCSDASCYLGHFKFGVKHGLGCYHFRNGDRYAGEYFGDKIHGFGVYHFANGHCYEGSWHEGRKQGFGMYTFRNGESKCGEWDNGSLKTPLPPLTDSVLRAVQAARKAAENAINLRRVDEQVNKAVMAANRAATAARVAAVKAVQNRMDGKSYDTYV